MRGILGIIFAGGGVLGAWWAFIQAEAGEESYYLIGLAGVIVCIIGIILIGLQIKKWWMTE